jgi:hypothetical protein
MKRFLFIIFFLFFCSNIFSDDDVDQIKGIGTSIFSVLKSVPSSFLSFWKTVKLMGAAPGSYYYQYLIFNDTAEPVWVGTQQMRSIMGAIFPQANSWDCGDDTKILPYERYPKTATITISSSDSSSKGGSPKNVGKVTDCQKHDYYFEMFIKTSDKKYSNHMPYLQHDDVLYQLDKLTLAPDDKNSNHCDIFRIFMGKELKDGRYVHSLKAEIIGSIATSSKAYKNAISVDSKVQSINIKNSTNQNYYVGFYPISSAESGSTDSSSLRSVTSSQCIFLGLVEKDSFGLLTTTGSITSFNPGVIAIFTEKDNTSSIATLSVPKYSFNSLTYTLEIFQDPGKQVACAWQGIMPGNYDMPSGRVRDITPIIGSFWYQSAAQVAQASKLAQPSGYDLPGFVSIVSYEKNSKKSKILAQATPGQVVQFQIERAAIDDKKELYFLYSSSVDTVKVNLFIKNFLSGKIGASIMSAYEKNLDSVMNITSFNNTSKKQSNDPKDIEQMVTMVNQIAFNSVQMNRGQLTDVESGITGFLLGMDSFMPVGMAEQANPSYYVLTPSLLQNLPTNSIANYMNSAPQGLPTTIVNSTYAPTRYSIAASS